MLQMTTLNALKLNKDDFITSDKLFNFCQKLNSSNIQYIKTDFITHRIYSNMIRICNWRNIDRVINIEDVNVLVTGHSDYCITSRELDLLNNDNLSKWFCQNLNIKHPKLISFPLGITNKDEPNSIIHQFIGNTDRIYTISKTPKIIKNVVYMNFSIHTYPNERQNIHNLYKNKSWVTTNTPVISEDGHYTFLNEIYSHKFVFAPRGNGIDTHRLWESLYLRSIPIVKKCLCMEQFYDLPILFVDDWNNITEDFLNKKYDEMMNKTYPLEKLTIDYWMKLISSFLIQK